MYDFTECVDELGFAVIPAHPEISHNKDLHLLAILAFTFCLVTNTLKQISFWKQIVSRFSDMKKYVQCKGRDFFFHFIFDLSFILHSTIPESSQLLHLQTSIRIDIKDIF